MHKLVSFEVHPFIVELTKTICGLKQMLLKINPICLNLFV